MQFRLTIRISVFIMVAAVVALAASCNKENGATTTDGKLTVVTTTGMIADAVRNIAGDSVTLYGLMGPGVDPHLYKATKGDIDRLNSADIILYNGLNLEAKMTDIFKQMASSKTSVPIGEVVPDSLRRHPAQFQGHPDPHIWFDVSLWRIAVEQVAQTLINTDADQKDLYARNAAAYLDSLAALDVWVREQTASIPEEQRILVTAHDAFGYFGRAYGLEVEGLRSERVRLAGLEPIEDGTATQACQPGHIAVDVLVD